LVRDRKKENQCKSAFMFSVVVTFVNGGGEARDLIRGRRYSAACFQPPNEGLVLALIHRFAWGLEGQRGG